MLHPLEKIRRLDLRYYAQWVATLGVLAMTMQNGIQIGWTSPNLARFIDPNATDSPVYLTPEEASWVVSSMSLGGVAGAVLGPASNEYLGARRSILLTLVIVSLEWASLAANAERLTVGWLYFARALGGLAFSMSMSCFSIYLSEVSIPETRGTLISVASSGTNLGTFVGTIAESYGSMRWTSSAYLVMGILSVILFLWLKDSPYYSTKVGDFESARKSISQYNGTKNTDKEFDEIKSYVEAQISGSLKETCEEFKKPIIQRSMTILLILFALPHLSGVMAVMAYMETILKDARIDLVDTKEFVIWVQLAGIATSFLTVNLLDKFGRRAMLVVSSVGVALALGSLGLNFYLLDQEQVEPERIQGLTIFGILFYVVTYAVGYAIIPATIMSEIFPENVKSVAACVACLVASFFSFFCMKAYQPMLDITGHAPVFWVFGLMSLTSVPFALFVMPETNGKTFQQIQDDLAKSMHPSTVALALLVVTAWSCPMTRRILYQPAFGASCANLSGSSRLSDGYCAIETCLDLLDHSDRWYCGVGNCDPLGENCEGGCIQLDPWGLDVVSKREARNIPTTLKDVFRMRHRDVVSSVLAVTLPYFSVLGDQDFELSSKVPIQD